MPIQKRGGIESSPENSSRTRNGSKYLSSNLQAQAAIEPDPKISKNEARKHHKAGRQGRRLTCRCCGGRRRRRPRAAAAPGTCAPPAGASPLPVCHRARTDPHCCCCCSKPASNLLGSSNRRPRPVLSFLADKYDGRRWLRRCLCRLFLYRGAAAREPASIPLSPEVKSDSSTRLAGFLVHALLSVRENYIEY